MFCFKRVLLLPALFLLFGVTTTCLAQEDSDETSCSADGTCDAVVQEETPPKQQKPKLLCEDKHEKCLDWANTGECTANAGYMNVSCRRSCELCADQARSNPMLRFQELSQGSDLGVVQILEDSNYDIEAVHTTTRLERAREYMQTVTTISKEVKDMCRNGHEKCTVWALLDECDTNPTYMLKTCAPVCHSCDYLTVQGRCPIDPDAPSAWHAGDLETMFTKLTNEPYLSTYSVDILSSPSSTGGPWVITMDNVISLEETERLIALGHVEGFKRSADVGKKRPDGTFDSDISEGRTSTNAWCQHECYKDETAQAVMKRLSNLTGIEEPNSEFLQLLKYEPGQFYNTHHDYISQQLDRQEGVRILTVYLYLNGENVEGGGTNFDQLDITVMPKRGRALLWPSVYNDPPDKKDPRTSHQALPVEKGVKFGANAWFHMHDFKTPNENACTL